MARDDEAKTNEAVFDGRMDAALRAMGPRLPEPSAPAEVRRRIGHMVAVAEDESVRQVAGEGAPAVRGRGRAGEGDGRDDVSRQVRFLRTAVYALAACVALFASLGGVAWLRMGDLQRSLAEISTLTEDGPGGVEQLTRLVQRANAEQLSGLEQLADLVRGAGGARQPRGGRYRLAGMPGPRYVAICFNSEMCPRAKEVVPEFYRLRERHRDDGNVVFVCPDVTEAKMNDTWAQLAKLAGLECAFDDPQTGVVKVVDRMENSIVLTGYGHADLERVEQFIASECCDAGGD